MENIKILQVKSVFVFSVLSTIMAQTGTINDLLNKSRLDNPEEETLAARNLRQARRGRVGGVGTDRRRVDGSKKDNLGRPVMPERPLPASRQAPGGEQESEPGMARQPVGQGGSDIDSRLMAGQLREEKNKEREKRREAGGEKGEEAEKSPEGEKAKEGGGLTDRIRQLKEKANLKKRAQKKIEEKVTKPINEGTSKLLDMAWNYLIPSWGLSLIWINIHVFLNFVLGDKYFRNLKSGPDLKKVVGDIKSGNFGITKILNEIGISEWIQFIFLDLVALVIIGGALALIAMIANFMGASWWEKAKMAWEAFGALGWKGIKALIDLF